MNHDERKDQEPIEPEEQPKVEETPAVTAIETVPGEGEDTAAKTEKKAQPQEKPDAVPRKRIVGILCAFGILIIAVVVIVLIWTSGSSTTNQQSVVSAESSSSDVNDEQESSSGNVTPEVSDNGTESDAATSEGDESELDEIIFAGESDGVSMFPDKTYSYRNDTQLSAESYEGGTLTVGVTEADEGASEVTDGLILNIHYDYDDSHTYGVQVFTSDTDTSMLAVCNDGSFSYLSMSTWGQTGRIGREDGETVLLYRTWDQQLRQEYRGAENYGLVWCYDEATAHVTSMTVQIRLCDLSRNTMVDVFTLTISYDEDAELYYLDSLEQSTALGSYNNKRLDVSSAVQESVAQAALDIIDSGVLFASTTMDELDTSDVIVYDVDSFYWCEASGFYGEIYTDDDLSDLVDGHLVAATVRHTNDIMGSITIYFNVSVSVDYQSSEVTFDDSTPEAISYDFFAELTWNDFLVYNGFSVLEGEKFDNSNSVEKYQPTWYHED